MDFASLTRIEGPSLAPRLIKPSAQPMYMACGWTPASVGSARHRRVSAPLDRGLQDV